MGKVKIKRITVGDIIRIANPWCLVVICEEAGDHGESTRISRAYTYDDWQTCEFKDYEVITIYAREKGYIELFV